VRSRQSLRNVTRHEGRRRRPPNPRVLTRRVEPRRSASRTRSPARARERVSVRSGSRRTGSGGGRRTEQGFGRAVAAEFEAAPSFSLQASCFAISLASRTHTRSLLPCPHNMFDRETRKSVCEVRKSKDRKRGRSSNRAGLRSCGRGREAATTAESSRADSASRAEAVRKQDKIAGTGGTDLGDSFRLPFRPMNRIPRRFPPRLLDNENRREAHALTASDRRTTKPSLR
jgi:hypothetical protein